jgi:type IV secretion system protein VirB11
MEILELLLQKLDKYLDDETITEFSIIKDGEIRCRKFSGERMTIFDENIDRQYLQSLVRIIATKQNRNITDIDNFSEELQLSYKGNIHRISTEFGGLRQDGFVFTIRLKRNYNICFEDFQMDKKTKNIILDSLKNKKNILISAGTNTGKTTFINALLKKEEDKSKTLITIENTREIDHKDFEFAYSYIYDNDNEESVMKAYNKCLRSSPDILILGEIRQESAKAFLNIINSGHDGTISTIHASSTNGAIEQLTSYIIATNKNMNRDEIKTKIESGLDLIIQLEKTIIDNKPQVKIKEIKLL